MKTARWSWVLLVIASAICLFFGVIVRALCEGPEPTLFLTMGVSFLICALVLRRSYKRYEAEVLPLAAEELRDETPNPNAHL